MPRNAIFSHELSPHPTPAPQNPNLFQDLEPTTTSRSRADYTFPEGGWRAWLVIFGSFSIISGTFGLISSAGLFQAYWKAHQLSSYASRDVGWILAVNVFMNLFLGVQIGPLFDRYGPRWLLLPGSVGYVVSLVLLAECKKYWHFMLVYGIPALEHLSWAWAMRLIALIVLVMMTIGNLCIRGRLPPRRNGGAVDLRCFQDARFSWATMGVACFEFVLFGTLGILPTYALGQGFSNQTSFNIVAVLNAGSAFGRSFSGYFSDRYGRFNTMILTLTLSLVVTFALWLPVGNHVILFYVFAPLFGFGSGSIISMAPVCIGQLCKADEYGQFYGTSYSVVAFATLICIPIAGELLPTIGPTGFVAFFGGILLLSLGSFFMARWACLDYKWKWLTKI
ncbi:putative transporter MCH4 [Lachnellula arida]|uniref:Putative transporter MCH4 n=1 Tax=Lachnellula arida TaxID=1316785 RepID=A0A8T9BBG7_9HELO|nr:putative transporter MCH4 [Lachnellula arida]